MRVDDAGQHRELAVIDDARTCRHVVPRGYALDRAGGHINGGRANTFGHHDALRSDDEVGHYRRRLSRLAHTGEVRAATIAILLAGCADHEPPTTNEPGDEPAFEFGLSATWSTPYGAPEVEPRPAVFIDGIETMSLKLSYGSFADAEGQQHLVELRHGALVVESFPVTVDRACLNLPGIPLHTSVSLCAYSHGELRFGSDTGSVMQDADTIGACVGDGFCRPDCFPPDVYCMGRRCTSIYGSVDPLATHLGCAAIGSQAVGETCSLVTDDAGTHDNCGAGLLCVTGVCRSTCIVGGVLPQNCAHCSYVPGHAPEIGLCD
ncbi:MAG TPA: hypothetical protein VIV11_01690 [Kofleriaceae bacterium]